MGLIVKKYGGATLESPEKIKSVALRIAEQKNRGDSLLIVVSAMGKTTDGLLQLAGRISSQPPLREMDQLLCTGEIISMSLLSIALHELGCPAISLTGAQAGIHTNRHFSNAAISEITPTRIEEALREDKVVIVAGFQGIAENGDLTTLGRGGSDTTAVALAAALRAQRCEILKDVPAVFSADPRIVPTAHPLANLSYENLLEMTYWGAKVLQYRSVEIAKNFNIKLYVGPAHSYGQGSLIEEASMIENAEILSLNSHDTVLRITSQNIHLKDALAWFKGILEQAKIPYPQVIHSEHENSFVELYVTGPSEILHSIAAEVGKVTAAHLIELSSVTATCRGSTAAEIVENIINCIEGAGIRVQSLIVSSMSVTVLVEKKARNAAITLLHQLIPVIAAKGVY